MDIAQCTIFLNFLKLTRYFLSLLYVELKLFERVHLVMKKLIHTIILFFLSCSSPEFVKLDGAITDEVTKISPAQALDLARPHLDVIFHLRCHRRTDQHWCQKIPTNYITQKGDWYCVIRESYPYKTVSAYWDPCVRVNKITGKVILPTKPDI